MCWLSVLHPPLSGLLSLSLDIGDMKSSLRRGCLGCPIPSNAHIGTGTAGLWVSPVHGSFPAPRLALYVHRVVYRNLPGTVGGAPGQPAVSYVLLLDPTFFCCVNPSLRAQSFPQGGADRPYDFDVVFLTVELSMGASSRGVCAGPHWPKPVFLVSFTLLGKSMHTTPQLCFSLFAFSSSTW